MNKRIEHLFKLSNKPIALFFGGVPGSGKSTLAKEFEKNGFKIICPDTYRGILSRQKPGHENWANAMCEGDQSVSKEAWDMAYKEAITSLKNGQSIVFDAMLHNPKSRRKLFAQLDRTKVDYYAVYNDVLVETALERNSKRERQVPPFVIEEKWRVQSLPMIEEGFKEVIVLHNDLEVRTDIDNVDREKIISYLTVEPRKTIETWYNNGELEEIFPSFAQCWGIRQDNIHHTQELHEHMIKAAELVEDKDPVTMISTLLHDVGKSKTKEFFVKIIAENEFNFKIGEKIVAIRDTGKNGVIVKAKSFQSGGSEKTALVPLAVIEKDMNAHFYDHENVGAMMARRDLIRLGFDEEFANEVYANILYHMDLPYSLTSNKSMKKLIRKVGNQSRMNALLAIRKADKLSSNTSGENFVNVHEEMVKQVNDLFKQ